MRKPTNPGAYLRLPLALLVTAAFTKISMERTGEFRGSAVVVGLLFSIIPIAVGEALFKWLFKKEGRLDDAKFVAQATGGLIAGLVAQGLFSLGVAFVLFVIAHIIGLT